MRTLTITLILLSGAFAGCINAADVSPVDADGSSVAGLSEAVFEILPGESLFHDASIDAVELHMRLFRPDADPEWKAPTILVMSPYFGPDSREGYDETDPRTWDSAARPAYWRYQWLIDHFVPRGYAVAFSDVRGTGESGGCLEQTGPLQSQDGYDVVEWLASQEWSNGKVGMYGKSYDAETQQSTATLNPPGLVTIIPVSSVAGQYDYSYYDGVPYTGQTMLVNVGYAVGDGLQPGSTAKSQTMFSERVECNVGHFVQGADTTGTWNAYWEDREFRKQVENVTASVLYVHGLQDWNVKPNSIRDWFEAIPSPKTALLGQWAHDYPDANAYNADWSRQDWQLLVWQWYDHYLLDKKTSVVDMLGTVQMQDSAGAWRQQVGFPAADAVPVSYHLVDDALTLDAKTGRARSYMELSTDALGAPIAAGPRAFVQYTSAPLEAPLRWSGWPTMTLNVTIDRDDAHFIVHLVDVGPDGASHVVNRAYLSAQHRDGITAPSAVPTGEQTYALRFFPSDTVIDAGHQIRVVLTSSDDWTMPAGNGHTATIHSGALTFPTVAPAAASFMDIPLGKPVTAPLVME